MHTYKEYWKGLHINLHKYRLYQYRSVLDFINNNGLTVNVSLPWFNVGLHEFVVVTERLVDEIEGEWDAMDGRGGIANFSHNSFSLTVELFTCSICDIGGRS